MDVRELLEAKGIDYVNKGGDEISIVCPHQHLHAGGRDDNPSFGINIEKRVGHCFACSFSLNEAGLHRWLLGEELDEFQELGLQLRGILSRLSKAAEVPVVEEEHEVFFPSGEVWNEDYRGIPADFYQKIGAVKVTRGRYQNRLAVPIYVDGKLIGVDARALGDEQPKYLRNKGSSCRHNWLFPFDLVKAQQPKMVLLGEGLFHALKPNSLGYPALCFFGTNNFSANKIMMLLATGAEEICFFADPDKAGCQAAQKICAALTPWFKVTLADLSVYYESGEDLGDLDAERIELALAGRGKIQLPLCLLQNWEFKIEFAAECKKWKCPFNRRGNCGNELYEPEIKEVKCSTS